MIEVTLYGGQKHRITKEQAKTLKTAIDNGAKQVWIDDFTSFSPSAIASIKPVYEAGQTITETSRLLKSPRNTADSSWPMRVRRYLRTKDKRYNDLSIPIAEIDKDHMEILKRSKTIR